jgi:hypothetical protein
MTRRFRWCAPLLVLALIWPCAPGYAQDEAPEKPLVIFIEDDQLGTASFFDDGPDGLTELEGIFQDLGADVRWLPLDGPLPDNARVVVLARPTRALPAASLARLWLHLARGNNLLLTMDPIGLSTVRNEGTLTTNPDKSTSGLAKLLTLFYGISLRDTFLAEPWFANASIVSQNTTFLSVYAENIAQHPVAAPLIPYDLPVQMWGARSMTVEPIGPGNYAVPLLYTESAYGETNAKVFPRANAQPDPLELNLGQDSIGRLFTGALAENTQSGSRVVVLGDSEALLNGYGLAPAAGGEPLYPGNRLLAGRIAAWLLELPEADWPPPPDTYTRLALDGSRADWGDFQPIITDPTDDASIPRYDIQEVRAFRDDSYLHLAITTAQPPNPETLLSLGIENTFDGIVDVALSITDHETLLLDEANLPSVVRDVQMTIGDILEVRLPVRLTTEGALIGRVCLSDSRAAQSDPIDCIAQQPALVPLVQTRAPFDMRYTNQAGAIVRTLQSGVNARSGPDTSFRVVDVVPSGRYYAAVGRTALGDWVQIQNATYTAWIAISLIDLNGDLSDLPIVSTR